jgi:DUF1365 family protein
VETSSFYVGVTNGNIKYFSYKVWQFIKFANQEHSDHCFVSRHEDLESVGKFGGAVVSCHLRKNMLKIVLLIQ